MRRSAILIVAALLGILTAAVCPAAVQVAQPYACRLIMPPPDGVAAEEMCLGFDGDLFFGCQDGTIRRVAYADGSYATSVFADGFGYIQALHFDGAFIYAADAATGAVWRIGPSGNADKLLLAQWDGDGTTGCALSPGGAYGSFLYLACPGHRRIGRLRPDTPSFIASFATCVPDPEELAFGPGGEFGGYLYCAEESTGMISRFEPEGYRYVLAVLGDFPAEWVVASALAFSPPAFSDDGKTYLWTADMGEDGAGDSRILRVASDGSVFEFATGLTAADEIVFDGTDMLVLSAEGVHRISRGAACPQGWLRSGWNLISLPVVPEDTAGESVLADIAEANPLVGRLFRYSPAAGYEVYPDDFSLMQAGRGYWLMLDQGAEAVAFGDPSGGSMEIPLEAGWNLFGVPFDRDVAPADCLIRTPEGEVPFTDAADAGIVQPDVFFFDGEMLRVGDEGDDDHLRPWRGYWLLAHEDGLTLVMPAE